MLWAHSNIWNPSIEGMGRNRLQEKSHSGEEHYFFPEPLVMCIAATSQAFALMGPVTALLKIHIYISITTLAHLRSY